jgi:hypothetical protein
VRWSKLSKVAAAAAASLTRNRKKKIYIQVKISSKKISNSKIKCQFTTPKMLPFLDLNAFYAPGNSLPDHASLSFEFFQHLKFNNNNNNRNFF